MLPRLAISETMLQFSKKNTINSWRCGSMVEALITNCDQNIYGITACMHAVDVTLAANSIRRQITDTAHITFQPHALLSLCSVV